MIEDQLERLISAMGRLTAALEASGAKPTAAPAQSTVAKSATVEPKSAPAVAPFVMDESSAPAVAPTAAPAQSTVAITGKETAKDGAEAKVAIIDEPAAVPADPVPATVTLEFLKARCLECSKLGKMAVLKEFLISKNAKRIQDLAPDEYAVCYQHLLSKGACSKGD